MSDVSYSLEDIQKNLKTILGQISFSLVDHSHKHADHYTGISRGPTHIFVLITSENTMTHRDKIDLHRQILAHLAGFIKMGLHNVEIRVG